MPLREARGTDPVWLERRFPLKLGFLETRVLLGEVWGEESVRLGNMGLCSEPRLFDFLVRCEALLPREPAEGAPGNKSSSSSDWESPSGKSGCWPG